MVYEAPDSGQISVAGLAGDAVAHPAGRLLFLYAGVRPAGPTVGVSGGDLLEPGARHRPREQSAYFDLAGAGPGRFVVRFGHLAPFCGAHRKAGKRSIPDPGGGHASQGTPS